MININEFIKKSYNNPNKLYLYKASKINGILSNNLLFDIIIENKYIIAKYIKYNKLKFKYCLLKHAIKFKRNKIFKILFDKTLKQNNIFLQYAMTIDNLQLAGWLMGQGIKLYKYTIYDIYMSKNNKNIEFLFKNSIPCYMKDIHILFKDNIDVANIVLNCKIKTKIITGETTINLNKTIKKIMKEFPLFVTDFKVLQQVWETVHCPLLFIALTYNNIGHVEELFSERNTNGLDIENFFKLYTNFLTDNHICQLDKYIDDSCEQYKNQFVVSMLELSKYKLSHIYNNKNICQNETQCKEAKNNTSLYCDTWTEVFEDKKSNDIIYINSESYCFILQNLLKYWETQLNSRDILLVPKYPDNPYTRQKFLPCEFYHIIGLAAKYCIEIPFIVFFFANRPQIVDQSYSEGSKYLRDIFRYYFLEYSEQDNKWQLIESYYSKYPHIKEYYESKYMSIETASILLAQFTNISQDKLI